MTTTSVNRTLDADLCICCEVCVIECPTEAITTTMRDGLVQPVVDAEKCIDCGRCLRVCPGYHPPLAEIAEGEGGGANGDEAVLKWVAGDADSVWIAAAADPDVREGAVSGGAVSALLTSMLGTGDIERAFVLDYRGEVGEVARHEGVTDAAGVAGARGSKYLPATVREVARFLGEVKKDGARPRAAVVATPCQLEGLLEYARVHRIDLAEFYAFGLVCDRTLNYNVIRWFEERTAHGTEKLASFAFRTKEVGGWPGGSRAVFDSGRRADLARRERTQLKEAFVPTRCLVCADKLNRAADIVFGDCYIPGKSDRKGMSTVIVRTPKGAGVFERHSAALVAERSDLAAVEASQHTRKELADHRAASAYRAHLAGERLSDSRRDALGALDAARATAALGRSYDIAGIERHLAARARQARTARLRSRAALALVLLGTLVRAALRPRVPIAHREGDTVFTVGAGFENRGAHAMALVTLGGFSARRPGTRLVLGSPAAARLSPDPTYRLDFAPWTPGIKARLLFPRLGAIAFPATDPAAVDEMRAVLGETRVVVDLSGFRLGVDWGLANSLDYLWNILVARVLGVPYAIMPQSFGPFTYRGWHKAALWPFMKVGLGSPEIVYAREREALGWVRRFTTRNVELHRDVVLGGREHDPALIYRDPATPRVIEIDRPAVGLVTSERAIERAGDGIFDLYARLVSLLRATGRTVYLIVHSAEDRNACLRIKADFAEDDGVVLVEGDLDPVELEHVLGQLDFMVASRYHSVVHAYKQAVPAVILGWAVKYAELAGVFGQERYVFHVGKDADADEVVAAVERLAAAHAEESARIRAGLSAVSSEDIFDRLAGPPAGAGERA